MEKIQPKVKKDILLSLLEGYRKANELVMLEKRRRLLGLTPAQSLHEYDTLCSIWERTFPKEDIEKLERQKISFLLERRRRFNKIGNYK